MSNTRPTSPVPHPLEPPKPDIPVDSSRAGEASATALALASPRAGHGRNLTEGVGNPGKADCPHGMSAPNDLIRFGGSRGGDDGCRTAFERLKRRYGLTAFR